MLKTLRELYDKIEKIELTYLAKPIIRINSSTITIIVEFITEEKLQMINEIFGEESRIEAHNDTIHIVYLLPFDN